MSVPITSVSRYDFEVWVSVQFFSNAWLGHCLHKFSQLHLFVIEININTRNMITIIPIMVLQWYLWNG